MSRVCDVCGKSLQHGHNVSHANNKSNRTFRPNLQSVRAVTANGTKKKMTVCTRCLRSNKVTKAI